LDDIEYTTTSIGLSLELLGDIYDDGNYFKKYFIEIWKQVFDSLLNKLSFCYFSPGFFQIHYRRF